jgi:hypothetical protein
MVRRFEGAPRSMEESRQIQEVAAIGVERVGGEVALEPEVRHEGIDQVTLGCREL